MFVFVCLCLSMFVYVCLCLSQPPVPAAARRPEPRHPPPRPQPRPTPTQQVTPFPFQSMNLIHTPHQPVNTRLSPLPNQNASSIRLINMPHQQAPSLRLINSPLPSPFLPPPSLLMDRDMLLRRPLPLSPSPHRPRHSDTITPARPPPSAQALPPPQGGEDPWYRQHIADARAISDACRYARFEISKFWA